MKGQRLLFVEKLDRVFRKNKFICKYCGFDGGSFENWVQMSLDHILPICCGGDDAEENLTPCCRWCNSVTSRMKFAKDQSREDIIRLKREKVQNTRREEYKEWERRVRPWLYDR